MILGTFLAFLVLWLFTTDMGKVVRLRLIQGIILLMSLAALLWCPIVILVGGFWGKV